MGWDKNVRRQKWVDCDGICEYCYQPIESIKNSCLHHKKNRSQGGQYNYENAELRHKLCERECHSLYKHGNPSEGLATKHSTHKVGKMKKRGRKNDKNVLQQSKRRGGGKNAQQNWRSVGIQELRPDERLGEVQINITVRGSDIEISVSKKSPELPKGHGRHHELQDTPAEAGLLGIA
jgi:hypothetical protein